MCEVLSEFSQPALLLPCTVCISVASLWLDQRAIDVASGVPGVRRWHIRLYQSERRTLGKRNYPV